MKTNPYQLNAPDPLDENDSTQHGDRPPIQRELSKAMLVVFGAAITIVIGWYVTSPQLGWFSVRISGKIRSWTFAPALVGAYAGYCIGSALTERDRRDATRALLTLLGGLATYVVMRIQGMDWLRAMAPGKIYGDLPLYVVLFVGIPCTGAAFALAGHWLGSITYRRTELRSATFTWTAVFSVVGAVVGNLAAMLGLHAISSTFRLSNDVLRGIILLVLYLVAVGGLTCFGFRRGRRRDHRHRNDARAYSWKPTLAAVGLVVGGTMGYHLTYYVTLVSWAGDSWGRFLAWAAGYLQGMPIGAIVVCLLGFCLAEILDRRSPLERRSNE